MSQSNNHVPVLLAEVLEQLAPKQGESYLDITAGYGGHASQILQRLEASHSVLVDRDQQAINVLTDLSKKTGVRLIHADFLRGCQQLVDENAQFDVVLADLGLSSPHLDNASRGFSIVSDGPLDMRMDQTQAVTAYDVVNAWSEHDLRDILVRYGEEPKSSQLARLIVQSRPINTTAELAHLAKRVWPGHSRVHPATRLFQAIRIAVNNELGQLEAVLPLLVKLLKPGGRLGIISFHSLEDRIVKQFIKEQAGERFDAELIELTRRPITASSHELVINPRSRSAKLRVVAKIKIKKEG
jgi:16S rRNA (cytosine1402-N4)-methyltransferase